MPRYILDTDHISLLLGGHQPTRDRVFQSLSDCQITVISVQEVFNGWTGRLGSNNERIAVYERLYITTQLFQRITIVNYDEVADQVYQQIIQANSNLAKRRIENDIRIAAIALANQATIVTRNYRDFNLVPGLQIEDWSL
ncbi:MAG: type II toxin-antitoxin system VapC family toxin [Alkalinema sp. RU_4_3]|nr:type II toxin-antitoxin system VapC family toxin [Alkalinema sp. RU_4_3]